MSRYHCCATCRHYAVTRMAEGPSYQCTRLGYATHPTYQFNCWDPKDNVRKLMAADAEHKKAVTPPE